MLKLGARRPAPSTRSPLRGGISEPWGEQISFPHKRRRRPPAGAVGCARRSGRRALDPWSRCAPPTGGALGHRSGFSLIELIIALSVSTLVLVGVVGIATQMVRFQMEGGMKGKVTGWTLMGLMRMSQELEDASVLVEPSAGTPTSDQLSGCSNYSLSTSPPGPLNAALPNTSFYYCVADVGTPAVKSLLRYANTASPAACPISPTPTCGAGTFDVVARDVAKLDSLTTYFRRADDAAGVEVRYIVGVATPSANVPTPVYMKVREKIAMSRSYGGAD